MCVWCTVWSHGKSSNFFIRLAAIPFFNMVVSFDINDWPTLSAGFVIISFLMTSVLSKSFQTPLSYDITPSSCDILSRVFPSKRARDQIQRRGLAAVTGVLTLYHRSTKLFCRRFDQNHLFHGRYFCTPTLKLGPTRLEHFRYELKRVTNFLEVLPDVSVPSLYCCLQERQGKNLLAAADFKVKDGRCVEVDLNNLHTRLKLHWPLHHVLDKKVRPALVPFGKVTGVTKGNWNIPGYSDMGLTAPSVSFKLGPGVMAEDLPHQIRIAGDLGLVVVPGKAPPAYGGSGGCCSLRAAVASVTARASAPEPTQAL